MSNRLCIQQRVNNIEASFHCTSETFLPNYTVKVRLFGKSLFGMNQPEKETPPAPLRGRFATPDEEAWHIFRRTSEQETPKRLEEAAKYLSGLISIAFTIFISRDEEVFRRAADGAGVTVACLFWLLSLVATLFVIFPLRWEQVSQSAADIERVHRASVRHKYRLLLAGVGLFLLALGMLAWVFVTQK